MNFHTKYHHGKTRLDLLDSLPKNLVCAEIGVFRGDFSREIVTRCKPRLLYLVDIFEGIMRSGDRNGEDIHTIDMGREMELVKARFWDCPEVKVVKATSWSWLGFQKDIEFAYLDTSHENPATEWELAALDEAVAPGGFICGHDFSPEFPAVIQSVEVFCELKKYTLEIWNGDKLPSFMIRKP